jgi:hypothetical protein
MPAFSGIVEVVGGHGEDSCRGERQVVTGDQLDSTTGDSGGVDFLADRDRAPLRREQEITG